MKHLVFLTISLISVASALACDKVDFVAIGDSQTGATWGHAYFGNFLQKCLKENVSKTGTFKIYGRGGTVPSNWMHASSMDKIETIERDLENNHKNIGSGDAVPACKKRIGAILDAHQPKKVLVFFGDNLISNTPEEIVAEFKSIAAVVSKKIKSENCFFLTPTYEMEVATKRNVKLKSRANNIKVISAIMEAVGSTCHVIDGEEVMKDSQYFIEGGKLKRIAADEIPGCFGSAANDNIHLCGEAAREFANRACKIISQ